MKYDCVVLPGFGGFVKHHVSATIDYVSGVVTPPRKAIGFNPQLTINDSLLIQAYIDTYDVSYPEAQTAVDAAVDAVRTTLRTTGRYELGLIGTLTRHTDGTLTFEPQQQGLVLPQLYGLPSIAMPCVTSAVPATTETSADALAPNETTDSSEDDATAEVLRDTDIIIRIPRRAVRWAAAAVIAVMLVASIPFIGRTVSTRDVTCGINLSAITALFTKSHTTTAAIVDTVAQPMMTITEATTADTVATIAQTEPADSVAPPTGYTIVLASMLPESNAKRYVDELKSKYAIDAYTMPQGKAYRVVTGAYDTSVEAQAARKRLSQESTFADVWIADIASL